MPRKDRTFNDRDVIRIIGRHLNREEKIRILDFFGLQDLPPLPSPKLAIVKDQLSRGRVEANRIKNALEQVESILSGLALVPGPQQAALSTAATALKFSLTIAGLLGTILSSE